MKRSRASIEKQKATIARRRAALQREIDEAVRPEFGEMPVAPVPVVQEFPSVHGPIYTVIILNPAALPQIPPQVFQAGPQTVDIIRRLLDL